MQYKRLENILRPFIFVEKTFLSTLRRAEDFVSFLRVFCKIYS